MKFCHKTMWLLVAVAVLLPAGCASQRGRLASKHEVNTAQLLAAARQYEKEGNPTSAAHIYRHVLKYHPNNNEAKQSLALVQQGKLRVEYDAQQLLATNNPAVRKNPQAREQLAKAQQSQREQVSERMAELIAQAAQNPTKIESDPTPAQRLYAVAKQQTPLARSAAKATPSPTAQTAAVPTPAPAIAQTEGVEAEAVIATTGFARVTEETPADWSDPNWRGHSLTTKCQDASADVLREVARLESPADADRKEGLISLAKMGPQAKSAAPAIALLLTDQNQLVGAYAAWALWEVDGDRQAAVDALRESLDSTGSQVVQFAAYTLGKMGADAHSAAKPLQNLLGSADRFTRLHAAEALMQIGDEEQRADATDTLLVQLNDEDANVRQLAAIVLGQADAANQPVAIHALTIALNDTDAGVRSSAALSLGAYGHDAVSATARLEQAARTDRTEVREAAQTALDCIQL